MRWRRGRGGGRGRRRDGWQDDEEQRSLASSPSSYAYEGLNRVIAVIHIVDYLVHQFDESICMNVEISPDSMWYSGTLWS